MKNIDTMIKLIGRIQSLEELERFFISNNDLFNYNWNGLIVFKPCILNKYLLSFLGSIPAEIQNEIKCNINIQKYLCSRNTPIISSNLLEKNTTQKSELQNKQLIIPIKGSGNEMACLIFEFNAIIPDETLQQISYFWLLLSSYIYAKYNEYNECTHLKLTKREIECIKWASEGKTSWEISQVLSISQRTVDFHLANCVTKTNSVNRQQAIAKCLIYGHLFL